MGSRDLLLAALRGEQTERPGWVPFVGVHGGALLDLSATAYLTSADAVVAGLLKAKELYDPDGLPLLFDLQLEAEVLGCELHWAEETPPSVISHPLELAGLDGLSSLPAFDLGAGRWPLAMETTRRMRAEVGDSIGLYGLITGPFTLASHLRGTSVFLDMFDAPEALGELLAFCAAVGRQAAQAYLDAGCDVIAVVDPMTSQISPEHFTEFVAPAVNAIFDSVRDAGGMSSLFVCGDASRNLAVMCATTCDNVSVDENIDLGKLRELATAQGKSFGGNLRLTLALLMGNEDDCRRDALRCLDIGGEHGFVLAPGCDLPYAVPPANLVAVTELVHQPYQRDVARQRLLSAAELSLSAAEMPDFAAQREITVDIVTLDSAACAPCQYMVNAVRDAVAQLDLPIVYREHKIKSKEGVAYMLGLGVQAIPSICIDGNVAFASLIPDQPTLVKALQAAASSKGV
jgi:uroporphyrinogen decarboxylase